MLQLFIAALATAPEPAPAPSLDLTCAGTRRWNEEVATPAQTWGHLKGASGAAVGSASADLTTRTREIVSRHEPATVQIRVLGEVVSLRMRKDWTVMKTSSVTPTLIVGRSGGAIRFDMSRYTGAIKLVAREETFSGICAEVPTGRP